MNTTCSSTLEIAGAYFEQVRVVQRFAGCSQFCAVRSLSWDLLRCRCSSSIARLSILYCVVVMFVIVHCVYSILCGGYVCYSVLCVLYCVYSSVLCALYAVWWSCMHVLVS